LKELLNLKELFNLDVHGLIKMEKFKLIEVSEFNLTLLLDLIKEV